MGVFTSIAIAYSLLSAAPPVPDVPFEDGWPVTTRDRIYHLSEVKRGDRGVGYTVFAADKPERFEFEVLGVMTAMLGPGRDVILVKLTGKKIEFTGVISGMSGSPAYVDGRLVGAVSYRFGAFAKEAIAGITPIESMLEIYEPGEVRPNPVASARGVPSMRAVAVSDYRARVLPELPFPIRKSVASSDLQPIAVPLSISGLDPSAAARLTERLESAGFVAAGGGAGVAGALAPNGPSEAGAVKAAPIKPGAPIAALLVRGDINLAAIGTVTMVEKNRVFGFGHPFMGYGHVRFPMATAAIINTLASPAGSYKQGIAARTVGAISHDRLTAIAGDLGDDVKMIPLRVVVQRGDGPRNVAGLETNVEIVDSPNWLPVMIDTVLGSAGARRLGYEAGGTVDYEFHIQVGGYTLSIKDTVTGPAPLRIPAFAGRDVATTVSIIERNDFVEPRVERIDVLFRTRPEVLLEEIVDVTPSRISARPGETVRITTTVRPFRDADEVITLDVPIPEDAVGEIDIVVGGGLELDQRDGTARGALTPGNLEELLAILQDRRPGRALYAKVYLPRPGLRDGTELYPELPLSARIARTGANRSGQGKLTEAFGPEVKIVRPSVVAGVRTVKVSVKR